jgi:hypothetical protein
MEGPTMSLSAWEQQALDSIKDGLVGSDPQLAGLLTTFTRLASGEEMPVQEEILGGSRTTPRPPRKPRHRRRAGGGRRSRPILRHVGPQWVMLLLLLVITVVLITVALVLSHGGSQGTCTGSWPTICSHSAPG